MVHPFWSARAVYPVGDSAKDVPSREVKLAAFENDDSAETWTAPLGGMYRRPFVAEYVSIPT